MPCSQPTSVNATAGPASDVIDDTNRQPRLYTVLIFGDEDERIRALRQIIAMPSVSAVIESGGTGMDGRIISLSKNGSLEKTAISDLPLKHTAIRNETAS